MIFTGGTGISPRDVTPDALLPMIDRQMPGIMETARAYGQERIKTSMLSRGIAGFSGDTFVLTFPGSEKGATEYMQSLFPQVLHVFEVKKENAMSDSVIVDTAEPFDFTRKNL
uniref:Molybdopterin-binding protein n=1 Tax=Chryseobacterium endophyticum TaxID=1854762 RepID=A0AAU6WLC9_9FLAO